MAKNHKEEVKENLERSKIFTGHEAEMAIEEERQEPNPNWQREIAENKKYNAQWIKDHQEVFSSLCSHKKEWISTQGFYKAEAIIADDSCSGCFFNEWEKTKTKSPIVAS